jgi:molybdopterin synthase catalytic subunit
MPPTNVRPEWHPTYTHAVPETSAETQFCVQVRLFASYRETAGTNRLDVPLPAGARVRDLIDVLAARLPALRTAPGLVAVNHTYVQPDVELHDGDEVAFIPPVSGGR